mgnify:CR=1 FL=1
MYALSPFPEARQTLIGVLSPDEAARVEGAMQETIYDYLVDAKEEGDEVVLHFKSGRQEKISQGSWLINCSGHLFLEKKEGTDPFAAQVIHNQIRCVEALPLSVSNRCGLNFDKWFPLHRQLPVVLNLLTKKKRHLQKTQETIQKVCDRYGVEVGVIGQS